MPETHHIVALETVALNVRCQRCSTSITYDGSTTRTVSALNCPSCNTLLVGASEVFNDYRRFLQFVADNVGEQPKIDVAFQVRIQKPTVSDRAAE